MKKVGKIQLPLQMPAPKTHFQTLEPGLLADEQLHCEVKSRAGIKLYETAHRKKKWLSLPCALTLSVQPRPSKASVSHCEVQDGKSYFAVWFYSRNLTLMKVLRVLAEGKDFSETDL